LIGCVSRAESLRTCTPEANGTLMYGTEQHACDCPTIGVRNLEWKRISSKGLDVTVVYLCPQNEASPEQRQVP
jgi:hypothetical protein